MNRNHRTPQQFILYLFTALIIASLLAVVMPANSVNAATQYLGGYTRVDDLKITLLDDGKIGVERYSGSSWDRQIYATSNKGSRLQFTGGNVSLGYFSGGSKTLIYNNSSSTGSAGSRTWTGEAKWNGGGFDIVQTVTYREGDPYFKLVWNITNVSGSSKADVRFFHGEDTYLKLGDNGAGWVDWGNYTIGVKKTVSGSEQRMALQGITPAYAYQSNNYYSVYQAVNNGSLSNTVDANESTDNGYALEWHNGTMSNNQSWTVTAYEKFNNASIGAVQVIAPVAMDCNKGEVCPSDLTFTVKNPGSTTNTVNMSISTSLNSWPYTVTWPNGSSSVTLGAGAQTQVHVRVTVPGDAANNSSMRFTLTATPTSGAAASDTAAVNAIAPPNSAPTNISFNGSQNIQENTASGTTLGTISATDPDGDAVTFSLVSGDTSYFSLSGSTLKTATAFNYEDASRPSHTASLTVRASDGKGGTADQALIFTITNQNEAPTLSQPATQITNEDTPVTFSMTATDPDNLTSRLNWSLLSAPANGSVSGLTGTGGSKSVTYTPGQDYNGSDAFTVRVTGEGSTTSDKTVTVNITAVNDAPVNSWNGGGTFSGPLPVRLGQTITFDDSSATHIPSRIQVADVEATTLQVTLSVSKGSLVLSGTSGLSGSADLTGTDGSLSLSGSPANINAALKGMSYTPNSGATGSDTLTITTSDLGATGTGGAKSDSDTLAITISNPTTLIIDDDYLGSNTAGWGYDHFSNITDALAAARSIDTLNNPKVALTLQTQAGAYPNDSIVLDNSRFTLQLTGDISLGKDFNLSAGTFTPAGNQVTFVTGTGSQTNHVLSGDATFFNLAVANGNTLSLASNATLGLQGALTLPGGPSSLDAIQDGGRTTLRLSGSGAQSLPTGLVLDNLTIANTVDFTAPAALTLQGSLTNNGDYASPASAQITFSGPGGRTQQIGGNEPQFTNVTLSSGSTVQANTDLTVTGNWTDNGSFDAAGHTVDFAGTGDQTFSGETVFADLTVSGSRLLLAQNADLGYSGAFTLTGQFNPTAATNTTVRLAGSGAQTLPDGVNTYANVVVNSTATLDATDRDLTLNGDLSILGHLDNSDGSVTFAGPATTEHALHLGPSSNPQFGSLTIQAGNTLTPDENQTILVGADWTDAGGFQANGGTVVFNGSTTHAFSGVSVLNNATIQAGSTLSLADSADFGYTGAVSGSLDPLSHTDTTVRLAGATSQTLPASLDEYVHLAINAGSSLSAANRDLLVHGDLSNAGSLTNQGGSVTFTGTGAHTLNLAASEANTQFGDLVIASGAEMESVCAAGHPFKVSGDWDNQGSFTPNQCEVIFNGNGAQQILGSGNGFYDLTIANTADYPNDEMDVDSVNPVTVSHTLTVLEGQFQPADDSTFASVILGGNDPEQTGILRPSRGDRLIVTGNWERKANGWFDANAGIIEFGGGTTSTITGGATFYNLVVNKTQPYLTLDSTAPVIVDNQLTVNKGMFQPSANSKMKNVLIETAGTLKPAGNINIGGDLTNNGAYTHNQKSVTFDGSGIQRLEGTLNFYNLTVNTGTTLEMQTDSVLGYAGALVLQGHLDATSHPHNTVRVMGQGFEQTLPTVTTNNLQIVSGASLKLMGNLTVTGDMQVITGGGFNANGYPVTFDALSGSDDPTFSGAALFNDVAIQADTTLYLKDNANLSYAGNLTGGALDGITSGQNTTLTVAGTGALQSLANGAKIDNLVIRNSADLSGNNTSFDVYGVWTLQGTGAFTPGNGTVTFKGDAAQTITSAGVQTFNHLVVAKTADTRLTAGVVSTSAALDVNSGEFAPACASTFYTVNLNGGSLILPDSDACEITVNEDWSANGGSFVPNGGSVVFDGGLDTSHTISGSNPSLDGLKLGADDSVTLADGTNLHLAGPLALDGTGSLSGEAGSTLTITGNLTSARDLTLGNLVIADGGELDIPHQLTLLGDLDNSGTLENRSGAVIFSGDATHNVTTGDTADTYFGDLTIEAGDTLAQTGTISVAGNWSNSGTYQPNTGTVVFNGTSSPQTIQSSGAENEFYNLTIDNTTEPAPGIVASGDGTRPGQPLSVANDLTILHGSLLVPTGSSLINVHIGDEGIIDLPSDGNSVDIDGAWDNQGTITTGGTGSLNQGAHFYLESAIVDASFTGAEPGFGFDKFNSINTALGVAQETIYVMGASDENLAQYAEDVEVDGGDPDPSTRNTSAQMIIQGNVQLNSLTLTSGTISVTSSSQVVTPAYSQADGSFDLGAGSLAIAGNFAPTGGVFDAGNGSLSLTGNFAPAADTFDAGTGTVTFNGSGQQTIAGGSQFYDLTVQNTASSDLDHNAVLAQGAVTIHNRLDIASGQFMPDQDSHLNDFIIEADGILKLVAGVDIYVDEGGSLDPDSAGQLFLNGGTIYGLPQATVLVDDDWSLSTSGFGFDHFADIPTGVDNVSNTLGTGLVKVQTGSYTGLDLDKSRVTVMVDDGQTVQVVDTLNHTDQSLVVTDGTLEISDTGVLQLAGDLTLGSGGALNANQSGELVLDGASLQTLHDSATESGGDLDFAKLTIDNAAGAVSQEPVHVSDTLHIVSGSFQPACGSSFANVTIDSGASLVLPDTDGCTIYVSGTWTIDPTEPAGLFVHHDGTVEFDGEHAQISGNAEFGSVKIAEGAQLTASTGTLTIKDNWDNQGDFDPNGGEVAFSGDTAQILTGALNFHDIDIAATSTLTPQADLTLTGDWTQAESDDYVPGGHSVTFAGDGDQALNGPEDGLTFDHLVVAMSAGETLTVNTPLTVNQALNVDTGNLTLNQSASVRNGDQDAVATLGANSTLTLVDHTEEGSPAGSNLLVDNWQSAGGQIVSLTRGGLYPTRVTAMVVDPSYNSTDTPGFGVDRFNSLTTALSQTWLADGATITVHPGTYPESVSVGKPVTIDLTGSTTLNSLIINAEGAVFDAPVAEGSNALTLNGDLTVTAGQFDPGSGVVVFSGAGRTFSSGLSLNDLTIANGADLTTPAAFTLAGDLNVLGSLDGSATTLTLDGTADHNLSGAPAFANIDVAAGQTLTLASGSTLSLSGALTLADGAQYAAAGTDATLALTGVSQSLPDGLTLGSLSISADTSFTAPQNLTLSGSLENLGAYVANTGSTLTLAGSAAQTLSGNEINFYNLVIDDADDETGANDTQALMRVDAANRLEISDGKFTPTQCGQYQDVIIGAEGEFVPPAAATCSIQVSGNWTNDGTFTRGSSQVTFNGSGPQTIGGDHDSVFTNLEIANTSDPAQPVSLADGRTLQVVDTLTVSDGLFQPGADAHLGDVVIAAGAVLDAPAGGTLFVSGDWSNAGSFNANGGTVIFTGSGDHAVSGSTSFNNLSAADGNTIDLQAGALADITGSLDFLGSATIQGDPDSTLSLTGSGPVSIPDGAHLGGLVIGSQILFNAPDTLYLSGDLTNQGIFNPGEGTVTFEGAGEKTITGDISFNGLAIADGAVHLAQDTDLTLLDGLTLSNGGQLDGSASGTALIIAADMTLPDGLVLNDLVVNPGVTATVPGDLVLYGDLTVDGVFDNAAGSTTFAGPENTVHVLGNTGTVHFGDLDIQTGNILDPVDGMDFTVAGDWTNDGTFNSQGITVTFNGSGDQTISGSNAPLVFENLTVDKPAGTLDTTIPVQVDQQLDLQDGTFQPADGSDFNDVTIAANGDFQAPNGTITVSGDWDDSGSFSGNGGTVVFDGAEPQSFSGDTRFSDIEIGSGSTLVLDGGSDLGFTGDFTIDAGGNLDATTNPDTTLTVAGDGDPTQTLPDGLSLDNLTVADPAVLDPADPGINLTLYGDLTVDGDILPGLSITFAGDGDQTISGSGEVHLDDVTIGPDSTLVPGGDLYVNGDWTDQNPDGGFQAGTGTVTFEGDGDHRISGETTPTFYDLVIDGGTVSGPVVVDNNLEIDSGATFQPASGSDLNNVTIHDGGTLQPEEYGTLNVSGDWIDDTTSGGGFIPNSGTIILDGDDDQVIGGASTPAEFYNLVITGAGTVTPTVPLDVNNDFRMEDDGGTLIVPDGSSFVNVIINPGSTFELEDTDPPAEFELDGSWSNQGTYTTNGGGLSETSHPQIDAAVVVPDCSAGCGVDTFDNIQEAIDAVAMDGVVTVMPGVYDTDGTDTIIMPRQSTDPQSGDPLFDPATNEPVYKSLRLVFQGSASDEFTILDNITQNNGTFIAPVGTLNLGGDLNHLGGSFNANGGTVVFASTGTSNITGLDTDFYNLVIDDQSDTDANRVNATAPVNVTHNLDITNGTFAPANCGQYANVNIGAQGIFAPQNDGACVMVSGNWDNDGTYTANGNTVTFNGTGSQTIGGSQDTGFANLVIDNSGDPGQVSLTDGRAASVSGDLTVTDGLFVPGDGSSFNNISIEADGSFQPANGAHIELTGDFDNQGDFDPNGSTFTFTGGADQALDGDLTFYDLIIDKDPATAVVDANGDLTVLDQLNVISGVLRFADGASFGDVLIGSDGSFSPDENAGYSISGDWTNNGTYTPNHDTVTFDGDGPQHVSGVSDFYNLVVDNTATPDPACSTAAECNTFYDANAVTFDTPIHVAGEVTVSDGQFSPMAGSTLEDMSISHDGRFRAVDDGDSNPDNNLIVIAGTLSNRGLFDLNGMEASGDFALNQLYVSSEYTSDTPGYGIDHFTSLSAALGATGIESGATITMYGGSYTETDPVVISEAYTIDMVSVSAVDNQPLAVAIDGSLALNNAEAALNAPAGTLSLTGDLDIQAGAFTANGGAVLFDGDGPQAIHGALTFYDLRITNTALTPDDKHAVAADSALIVTHELQVNDGQFSPQPCSTFHSVVIGADGILKPQGGTPTCDSGLLVTGDWTNNGGSFDPNGSLVTFQGDQPQSISGEDGFGDLLIDNPNGVTVDDPFAVSGDLTIENGTVTLPDPATVHNLTIGEDGDLALSDGATLTVTGDWDDQNPDGGFDANAGTVIFAGDGQQTISGDSVFHDIEVGSDSQLVLDEGANLGYSGDFVIDAGGSLDATTNPDTTLTIVHTTDSPTPQRLPGPGDLELDNLVIDPGVTLSGDNPTGVGQNVTLLGDFTNEGVFQGGDGTVTFAGEQPQTISGSGETGFNNLVIDGDVNADDAIQVGGTLTVADGGSFDPAGGSTLNDVIIEQGGTLTGPDGVLSITGDWQNDGQYDPGQGTVSFIGPDDQTISGETDFNNLTISTDGTVTVQDPLNVAETLDIDDGEFVQVQSGSFFDTIVIGSEGTLIAENGATDINTNHLDIQGSFSTPNGVFAPSNILWADDETNTTTVAEKTSDVNLGLLMTVDLNLEAQNLFDYTLVDDTAACGASNDNALFSLHKDGDGRTYVQLDQELDYEPHVLQPYKLCIRTQDPSTPTRLSVVKTVLVTPTDVNDEPVVTEDAADGNTDNQLEIHVNEDTQKDITLHATDQDLNLAGNQRDTLTWAVTHAPSHGNLVMPDDLTGNNLSFTYQTNQANWNGHDSLTFEINDGHSGIIDLTVLITVDAVNDPPVNVTLPALQPADQAEIGEKIQSTSGVWNDNNDVEGPGSISVTYQWQRAASPTDPSPVSITAARESAYYPTAADQGHYVRVQVTAHDSGVGTPASATTTVNSGWVFVPGQAPTEITLSHTTVAESQATGTEVGRLNTVDRDSGDVFTYALVAGTGDADNSQFSIDGNILRTAAVFSYAQRSQYSIRVQTTDGGGNTFARQFTIDVVGLQTQVEPKAETTVEYPSTDQMPADTTIEIPYGAVLDSLTLVFVPRTEVATPPQGQVFTHQAFDLTAFINGEETKDYEFNKPVTVTLTYPNSMIYGIAENSLNLAAWNGSAWENAACGDISLDPANNQISIPVCQLGQFALFGEQRFSIMLPFITR